MKPKRTAYGGLQSVIVLSDKMLSFDHISSIRDIEQSNLLTPRTVVDKSLLELHREFQQLTTFDCALQSHIRNFLNQSPSKLFADEVADAE